MRRVLLDLKFKGMRKPQSFIIYPVQPTDSIFLIQSDKKIGRVDLNLKKIYLSKTRSNGAYGPDLCDARGAKWVDLDDDQVTLLTNARNKMAGVTSPDRTVVLVGEDAIKNIDSNTALETPSKIICKQNGFVITSTLIPINHTQAKTTYFLDYEDGRDIGSYSTLEEARAELNKLIGED